ncbi:hypothetical protein M8C21_026326, partial [Ambrosia artemisiifolia]
GAGDCAPKHEGESKLIRKSRTTTKPPSLLPGLHLDGAVSKGTADKGDGEDGLVQLTIVAYLLGKDIRGAGQ